MGKTRAVLLFAMVLLVVIARPRREMTPGSHVNGAYESRPKTIALVKS